MSYFSEDTNAFLQRLADNNDREWFGANRAEYDRTINQPATAFAMTMATTLEAETGRHFVPKIFRIFRDVRFSKDKRSYNTHVRISFESGQGAAAPSYFFSLEEDHLVLGAGVFAYENAALDNFRRRIDGPSGLELQRITIELAKNGIRMSEAELKRVPAPYTMAHPRADLLRHKGLTVWIDALEPSMAYGVDAVESCISEFKKMKPLFDWMTTP